MQIPLPLERGIFLLAQQCLQHLLVPVQEVARDIKMLGLRVCDLADSVGAEFIHPLVRICEEEGRMRRDDELAAMIDQFHEYRNG